jgi:hypothetical protein
MASSYTRLPGSVAKIDEIPITEPNITTKHDIESI